MSYLDVISLSEAKSYLRIDDTQNDTDAEITLMIRSVLSYIEKATNHIMYDRDKTYNYSSGCVWVYDFPINSTVSTTHELEGKSGYSVYTDSSAKTIVLNVGYADPNDIPPELLEYAFVMLDYLYYGKDKDKSTGTYPQYILDLLNQNRRFIV